MSLDVFDQPVLVLAHLEEVVALAESFDRPLAVRTQPIHDILLRPEPLVEGAVPAGVVGAVDQILVKQRLERLLDIGLVFRIRGADEGVVGNVQPLPEGLELRRQTIAVRLRVHRRLLRGLLDLLAVLVEAREEEDVVAL